MQINCVSPSREKRYPETRKGCLTECFKCHLMRQSVVSPTITLFRWGKKFCAMILVPDSNASIGSERYYPEEMPVHTVPVKPFLMDRYAVRNCDFAVFVRQTGYRTTAETPLDSTRANEMPEDCFAAGSLVFQITKGPVPLDDFRNWWAFVPGACWKHPEGEHSTLEGREDHPVVHVSYIDARAYAEWCGKSLPTEEQWECAARAGASTEYPWGDVLNPDGRTMANTWVGEFPWRHDRVRNGIFTQPVNAFSASEYGLFNMIGNVWEWTSSRFRGPHDPAKSCCSPSRPLRDNDRMVLKGGSFLCSASYCERYRPAARSPQDVRSSASHIGFRCVAKVESDQE
jgi:formylglycine-generating enzyme